MLERVQEEDEVDVNYVDASSTSQGSTATSEYAGSSVGGGESPVAVAVVTERASTSAGPQRRRKKQ